MIIGFVSGLGVGAGTSTAVALSSFRVILGEGARVGETWKACFRLFIRAVMNWLWVSHLSMTEFKACIAHLWTSSLGAACIQAKTSGRLTHSGTGTWGNCSRSLWRRASIFFSYKALPLE